MRQIEVSARGQTLRLPGLQAPLDLERLGGVGEWEVEIGFGKGRYLIERAAGEPTRQFLGIEMARSYFHLAARRASRRSLSNLVLICGEALYVICALLPPAFATTVHIYFPDPWPKARHHRRRLFDPETVDLVLGLLRTEGELYFATDFVDYGRAVLDLLTTHPGCTVERLADGWPNGPRTNYEAKYVREGRRIIRLRVSWRPAAAPQGFHPLGTPGIVAAVATGDDHVDPIS